MIQVVNKAPESGVNHQSQLPLAPVQQQTVVILCGTLGAGKTSLAQGILSQSQNLASEKGMILNDPNLSVAQADAARIPSSVATQTLDGCACCSSNARLRQHLDRMLKEEGRKLIVIEGSGVTDGSELKRQVQEALKGSAVDVFSICLVDGSKIVSAPTTVLVSALLSADCVVVTHSDGSNIAALDMIENLRCAPPDFIQSSAGTFDPQIWHMLITSHSSRAALPPSDLGTYRQERNRLAIHSLALIGWNNLTQSALVKSLSESTALIVRAKGTLIIDGSWHQVQYALVDNSQARLAIVPCEPPTKSLLGGRPHLFVQSTLAAPQAVDFLSIGMPDFSTNTVNYYLDLYPDLGKLQLALGKTGVQVKSDGDMLFHSACGLFSEMGQIPPAQQSEYFTALGKLITRFITWRLDVLTVIDQEQGRFAQPDTDARKVLLTYELCWTIAKFGGAIQNREWFGDLWDRALMATPATRLFDALVKLDQIRIGDGDSLTAEQAQNLIAFASFACEYELMGPDKLMLIANHLSSRFPADPAVCNLVTGLHSLISN